MKKSRSLSLLLMSSLAIGASGCGSSNQEEQLQAFTSVEECTQSGLFSVDECRGFALSAIEQNPRFSNQTECEQQFGSGQCQTFGAQSETAPGAITNSTVTPRPSMWSPMLMGFLAGRFLGSGGAYMQGSQPLYKDNSQKDAGAGRGFRTKTGERVTADRLGKVTNPSPSLKQSISHQAKPVTGRSGKASTGGFSGSKKFTGSGS